jgi:uncharacterized membrane protein YoaK (UPF0700 family)
VVLVAFAVGAVVGGRATRRADVRVCWPPRVAVAILVACAIVAGVVVGWVGRDTPPAPDLLAALLAAAMGIQGGATRRLRVADLPTTVITSTMTGLASDSLLAGGEDQRWRRRLGAVVALLAGAVLGGVLSHGVHPAVGLLPAVAVLLGVGLAVVWPGIGPGRR